jgi:hypothetical protein
MRVVLASVSILGAIVLVRRGERVPAAKAPQRDPIVAKDQRALESAS